MSNVYCSLINTKNKKRYLSKYQVLRYISDIQQHTDKAEYAKNKIINNYLNWISAYARKMLIWNNVEYDDLIHEGICGLMHAVNNYKKEHNNNLLTYAKYWIRKYMWAYVSEFMPFKLSERDFINITKLSKIKFKLENLYGRKISNEDLAKYSGLNLSLVDYLIGGKNRVISYFEKLKEDDVHILLDVIVNRNSVSPSNTLIEKDTHEILLKLISCLPPKEREVIIERYFNCKNNKLKTFDEVGKKMNISKQRACRIEKNAISELKKNDLFVNQFSR